MVGVLAMAQAGMGGGYGLGGGVGAGWRRHQRRLVHGYRQWLRQGLALALAEVGAWA